MDIAVRPRVGQREMVLRRDDEVPDAARIHGRGSGRGSADAGGMAGCGSQEAGTAGMPYPIPPRALRRPSGRGAVQGATEGRR